MKCLITILFSVLLLPELILAETFALKDKECKMIGGVPIKLIDGENSSTSCSKTDEKPDGTVEYLCTFKASTTSTKFFGAETPAFVVLSSEGGGIKYVINIKDKTFNMGQVNILYNKGIVVSKVCNGRID